MSNKITSYYVPNKIANSYVANKRTETGKYMYDSAMQDIGMETQAAIQSLNKSYSNVINDAYMNYLNSKRSIMSSNLGQGYKEAYVEKQQEALQETTAQASLSAAETKQQLLQQQYESQAAVGKAFQTEVINMEKVGTQLTNYMEYLKNVYGKAGTSYYEDVISGKGLTDLDAKVGLKAEDIYDLLYNAQPKGYSTEGGEAAIGWMDWLKTQIKTEKEQSWYDWYVGEGGYEQFQDAYGSGYSQLVSDELAEQARRKEYDAAYAKAKEEYNIKKYAAKQKYDTEYNAAKSEFDKKVEIDRPDLDYNFNDFSFLDFGEQGKDKAGKAMSDLQNYAKSIGVSDEELLTIIRDYFGAAFTKKEYSSLKNAKSLDDYKKVIEKLANKDTENSVYNKIESDYRKIVNNVYNLAKSKFSFREFKYDDFEFASYEDYYK